MMNDLRSVAKLVEKALINHPEARNCDNYLYYVVCHELLEKIGLNIDRVSFSSALLNRKAYGLPPFETVRRTRQKIQEHHPELRGSDVVEETRAYMEDVYRDYARGSAI